jgi:hypothetical protein
MNSFVAGEADHQGFSMACCHRFDPCWLFSPTIVIEILERTDMVGSGAVVPCGDRPSPAL